MTYENKHEIDVTDENEVLPPDYQEHLDKDRILSKDQEFIEWVKGREYEFLTDMINKPF